MRPLSCLLGQHDDIRDYSPGHLRLRCLRCGRLTDGLRGPVSPEQRPVVTVRKLRKPRQPRLRVLRKKVG